MAEKPEAGDEKAKLESIEETLNEERNLRALSDLAWSVHFELIRMYEHQADNFVFKFLRGKIDFKINEYLTFKPSEIVITIGDKQRVFSYSRRKNMETSLFSLTKRGYGIFEILRKSYEGVKDITIPEAAIASKDSRDKGGEDLILTEIGEKNLPIIKETRFSMEYVPLKDAVEELLIEINKGRLKTQDPLENPFKGIRSQANKEASRMMDVAKIPEGERERYYRPAALK